MYPSLLPFNFQIDAESRFHLTFASTSASDVQTNVLVYLPIGASVWIALRRRGLGQIFGITAAALVGTAVSLFAELFQTMLPSRVASWTDVLLNAIGSLSGATLAVLVTTLWRSMLRETRRESAHRPFALAGSMLTLGLFVYHLAPFDFVTTTEALHRSFARAQWNPLYVPRTSTSASFNAFGNELSAATWFAVLGGLLGLAALEAGRSALDALGSGLKRGLALAATIECMQLFGQSHVAETNSVVMRGIALTMGAWCGVFLIGNGSPDRVRKPFPPAAWLPLLGSIVIWQVALLLIPGLNWLSDRSWSWGNVRLCGLPFENFWREPGLSGLMEAAGWLVTYTTLALSLMALLERLRISRAQWGAAGLVLLAACVAEAVPACLGLRGADPTVLPLSLLGGVLAVRIQAELGAHQPEAGALLL